MKTVRILVFALLVLCAALVLASCGNGKNTCTVTFDAQGGSAVPAQSVEAGQKLQKPTDPEKAGYTFDGWTYLGENWSFVGYVVTEDMTLTASWTPIKYAITYNLNGGTNAAANPATYTVEDAVTLAAPTRTGYTFAGWSDGGTIAKGSTGTKTFAANWEIITYAVSYELNGGTNAAANPATYTIEDAVALAAPTRKYYTFTGWSDGGKIAKGSTGDKTFTASWTPIEYAVTYDLGGGTNAASNPATFTVEDSVTLADPSKETTSVIQNTERLDNRQYRVTRTVTDYTFVGWYTENAFENKVTSVPFTGSDVRLYAKWSEATSTTTETKTVYVRDGEYIYFGEYPQTIKTDEVTITETQDARGYYLGSDGAYYAKVTAAPLGDSYTFSTGADVNSGTVYYFKVEPIKWRILSESDDVALILCDGIIANRIYDDDSNNYAESEIRAWLNGQFYETAFSELQRELILTTTVDNSARSTNPNGNATEWNGGANPYACANTQDKVFLLSMQEVTNAAYGFNASYGSNDTARRKQLSDYSRATGAWMSTSADYYGNGCWWLRSPYYGRSDSADVDCSGGTRPYTGSAWGVRNTLEGVVPALQIRL